MQVTAGLIWHNRSVAGYVRILTDQDRCKMCYSVPSKMLSYC